MMQHISEVETIICKEYFDALTDESVFGVYEHTSGVPVSERNINVSTAFQFDNPVMFYKNELSNNFGFTMSRDVFLEELKKNRGQSAGTSRYYFAERKLILDFIKANNICHNRK